MVRLHLCASAPAQSNHRAAKTKAGRRRRRDVALESLEPRLVMSTTTTLNFQIPAAVANMGVHVGIYSNADQTYYSGTGSTYLPIASSGTLPLIDLTPSTGSYTDAITVPLTLPAEQLNSGIVVMFVGPVVEGLSITGKTVGTPTPASNPQDTFSICEIDYKGGSGPNTFDADVTAVDQVDFPFTMTATTDPTITPYPLAQVGISMPRSLVFSGFATAAKDTVFAQCSTWHVGTSAQRLTAPQDVLQGEDVIRNSSPIAAPSATLGSNGSGGLTPGTSYYYLITATGGHTVYNSTIKGESLPSQASSPVAIPSGNNTASVNLTWSAYSSQTTAGYNIYRGVGTSGPPSTFTLIGQVDASKTSFEDTGKAPLTPAQEITPASASDYGFNGLTDYFTQSIQQFFDYYKTHDLVLDIVTDGTEWRGRTTAIAPASSGTGATYTVLQMTNTADPSQVVNIYEPFFSQNTRFVVNNPTSPAPTMPTWMTNLPASDGQGVSKYESPGEMIFACNGVFATSSKDVSKTYDPDARALGTAVTTDLAAMENQIASAFNRGVATDFGLSPHNWASPPTLSQAPAVLADAASKLAAGTYYYAVTAVNAYGETTPSLEVAATVVAGQSVTLNLGSKDPASLIQGISGFNTTTPTIALRGSLPNAYVNKPDSGYPPVYITGVPGISPLAALPVTSVDTANGTITVTLPSAPSGSYEGGGTITPTPTVKAAAAIAYNIYRGTSPGQLSLVATLRNGPSTTQVSFTDDGSRTPGARTIPHQYYAPGSASNGYSAFLHRDSTLDVANGVSINGLAYGFPFDDQAGLSTNVGYLTPPGTLTITIGDFTAPSLAFTAPSTILPDAGAGTAYQQTLGTSGGTGALAFSVVTGTLPPWLNLDASTGVLTGTPQAADVGAVGFSVLVKDAAGHTAIRPFGFNVVPFSFVTRSVSNADAGLAYNQPIVAFGGSGGNSYTLTTIPKSLPDGITLDSSSGRISGTSSDLRNTGFHITVQDSAGHSVKSDDLGHNITVNPALAIPSGTLPNATINSPYGQSIPTTGGDGAMWFTAKDLPSWLSLDPYTGFLSGTPTAAGSATFSVTAVDDLGSSATRSFTVTVNDAISVPLMQATSVSLTSGLDASVPGQEVPFTVQVAAASGVPTGTVTILGLGFGPLILPLVNGLATFRASLPLGTHAIHAVYSGDGTDLASSSADHSVRVDEILVASSPTGSKALDLGTLAGNELVAIRRHGKQITVRVLQTRGGHFHASRTYSAAGLSEIDIFGDPTHQHVKVRLFGGLKLPVIYRS